MEKLVITCISNHDEAVVYQFKRSKEEHNFLNAFMKEFNFSGEVLDEDVDGSKINPLDEEDDVSFFINEKVEMYCFVGKNYFFIIGRKPCEKLQQFIERHAEFLKS